MTTSEVWLVWPAESVTQEPEPRSQMITRTRTQERPGACCCTLLLYASQEGYPAVRKTSLTWVELSGLEPLTSCMP